MSSTRYLISLRPLKPFFFGGEQTFGEEGMEYVARSRYLPQQTQLLGALRLFLGEINGLIWVHRNGQYVPKHKRNAALKIIGDADGIGAIKDISPMFIIDKEARDMFVPTPFDYHRASKKIFDLISVGEYAYLEGYDVKNEPTQYLGGRDFWEHYLAGTTVRADKLIAWEEENGAAFIPHRQTGIALEKKRTIDKQFYLKYDYQLNPEYRFGFFLNLDSEITITDGILRLGADGSLFELKVHRSFDDLVTHPLYDALTAPPKGSVPPGAKVIPISPMMLQNGSDDLDVVFGYIPYLHHEARIISSREKATRDRFLGKTEPMPMLPTGSVLHAHSEAQMPLADGILRHIGYNRYITTQTHHKETTHV